MPPKNAFASLMGPKKLICCPGPNGTTKAHRFSRLRAEGKSSGGDSNPLFQDYMPREFNAEDYRIQVPPDQDPVNAVKVVTWNVNGLRSCLEKGGEAYLDAEAADVVCLQETKLTDGSKALRELDELFSRKGYTSRYWSCSSTSSTVAAETAGGCEYGLAPGETGKKKVGFAGVAVLSKLTPTSMSAGLTGHETPLNEEGRTINVHFESFTLVCTYAPNSGWNGMPRLHWRTKTWDAAFLAHVQHLQAVRGAGAVVVAGDLNVAHLQGLDVKSSYYTDRHPGCCLAERANLSRLLSECGLDDTYRRLHPGSNEKSWWGTRTNSYYKPDSGWRLDYFLASSSLAERIIDVQHRSNVYGCSDHVPVVLMLKGRG